MRDTTQTPIGTNGTRLSDSSSFFDNNEALQKKGYEEAKKVNGEVGLLEHFLNALFDYSETTSNLRREIFHADEQSNNLRQQIATSEEDVKTLQVEAKQEESRGTIAIKQREEEIFDKQIEIRRIKNGDYGLLGNDANPANRLAFYTCMTILVALTGYIVLFYLSVIYNAFILDVGQAAHTLADDSAGFSSVTIVNLSALPDVYYAYGIFGVVFLISASFMFLGMGFLIHWLTHRRNWPSLVGLYLFTVIFNAFLSFEIVKKIYESQVMIGLVEAVAWDGISMAIGNSVFWIILFSGFSMYIIWGLLLRYLLDEYHKILPARVAIRHRKAQIKKMRDEIGSIRQETAIRANILRQEAGKIDQQQIDKLRKDVEKTDQFMRELGSILKNELTRNGFSYKDMQNRIVPFFTGWCQYLIERNEEEATLKVKLCQIVLNDFFRKIPTEIATQGDAAITEYYHQKIQTGEELLLEAKVVLLGDGRSGKTSLANRLLGKPLPNEADRTQGVDIIINKYEFPVANKKKFKLHIWDFAGQDKYKPLHQFFYTESSLYVMVAESGNVGTDFDDWLQTAELFGEDSPLVVVLNEFRDGIGFGSFDREVWQKRFPSLLKGVFTVNLGTKRGFDDLEHQIRLLAQSLPHTRYAFPKNWVDIRRELEKRRDENFISYDEYLNICISNNLITKESALTLSRTLHKIGSCLHYEKNGLLKQFLILKNEWATEAVYKILDDTKVAEEKKGFFNHQDLERIWLDDEYCEVRPQLLELMQQFKMAYPLPGNREFVTPFLLPQVPPADWKWPEIDSLYLFVEYEFLPKALMTQFIVSSHSNIDNKKTLVWRNGVVLCWPDEALAEVTKTKLQGRDAFFIRSQGRDRKGLMTTILRTFRDLHSEYPGIKSAEKVPCPCTGCKSSKNQQHYFDFENLRNRLEKGRIFIECDKSLEEIDLLKLLENNFVFENMQVGQPLAFKKRIEKTDTSSYSKANLRSSPLNVFISYSKYDLDYKNTLLKHLAGLRGKIVTWDDCNILPGEDWDKSVKNAISKADVVLYLVTHNSIATEYIHQVELPLIERYSRAGTCQLIPVIVDYCDWLELDFAKLNALPEKGIPIKADKWVNENQAWLKVVEGLKTVLK